MEEDVITGFQLINNQTYGGNLALNSFSNLKSIVITQTGIRTFQLTECPVENFHMENNVSLEDVFIEKCHVLEEALLKYPHNKLKKIKISDCSLLKVVDISGEDVQKSFKELSYNPMLQDFILEECPNLNTLNYIGCNHWRGVKLEFDTPENIKNLYRTDTRINTGIQFPNLEKLVDRYSSFANLPLSLKSLIIPYSYNEDVLDLSSFHSLQELICNNSSFISIIPPSGKLFTPEDNYCIRYNYLRNQDIRQLYGKISPEMLEDTNIYPQSPRPLVISIFNSYNDTETMKAGREIDLSKEGFEITGYNSIFKWYKLTEDQVTQLRTHNVRPGRSEEYLKTLSEWENNQSLELVFEGPKYTPPKESNAATIICIISPTKSSLFKDDSFIDPKIYCLYYILDFSIDLMLNVDEQGWESKGAIEEEFIIKLNEGQSFWWGLELNYDSDKSSYHQWHVKYEGFYPEFTVNTYTEMRRVTQINLPYEPEHTEKGKYQMAINTLVLYYGERQVANIPVNMKFTIQIGEEDPPGPNPGDKLPPILQYKVKIDEGSYYNVPTRGTTTKEEGTDVYLGIIPDPATGNIAYDRWQIVYTDPNGRNYYSLEKKADEIFEFNPLTPHNRIGTYPYTATKLILYQNGIQVTGSPFTVADPYTIKIIKEGTGPGPNPPIPGIEIEPVVGICVNDKEAYIPFNILYDESPIKYRIQFSEQSKKAGFNDIEEFMPLPQEGYFTIYIPNNIPAGNYKGNINLRGQEGSNLIKNYSFSIQVNNVTHIITHPVSIQNLCPGDPISLYVEAEGDELSYQWYHNKSIIKGATSASYKTSYTNEIEGEYCVEVIGLCDSVRSDPALIAGNPVRIELKWDDVLYISNIDNTYVSFQWYKDGREIDQYGTSTYYNNYPKLPGKYSVRAYYANGEYEESCPLHISETTKTFVDIYPNPVSRNSLLSVSLSEDEINKNVQIDILTMSGKRVISKKTKDAITQFLVTFPAGLYLIVIHSQDGIIKVEKLIVKE